MLSRRTMLAAFASERSLAFLPAGKDISVRSCGAIGDGRSHPVSEWIGRRYSRLADIQVDYPDVRTLEDEIDFAALNRAARLAVAKGVAVWIPAGTYLGWLYVRANGLALRGAGSRLSRIKLPDGAMHQVIDERGAMMRGTPCVIEAGEMAKGNSAPPYSGIELHGLTLDGNRSATTAPSRSAEDIFGWGLAFTNVSGAGYGDIRAVDCHSGGVGTFIQSNDHIGECVIDRCGFALGHPGFDVNSSARGRWRIVANECRYGARLLDNVWGCQLSGRINQASLSGFVYDNQPSNSSGGNSIALQISGGCRDAGGQVKGNCSDSVLAFEVNSVLGLGVHGVAGRASQPGRRPNIINVRSRSGGLASCLIESDDDEWSVVSRSDGRAGAVGSSFAVDVYGSYNDLTLDLSDRAPARIRGLALRPGAVGNRIRSYRHAGLVQALLNQNP